MNSYLMGGVPPIRVTGDAAVPGSGPVESGRPVPTSVGWRERAENTAPCLGKLHAMRFLRLLPSDVVVTGTALVPAVVAGKDLAVFPLGLFGMYINRPGLPDIWTPSGAPYLGNHL